MSTFLCDTKDMIGALLMRHMIDPELTTTKEAHMQLQVCKLLENHEPI